MKYLSLAAIALAFFLFASVNAFAQDKQPQSDAMQHMKHGAMKSGHMHCGMNHESMEQDSGKKSGMKSEKSWLREEPIDVKSIDADQDGFVFQDHMDWNVISDIEGKCPECGMFLKKTSIADAEKNLRDHGLKLK